MLEKCPTCNKEFKQLKRHKCKSIIDELEKLTLKQQYKFIDLFCGIGGFHQALNKLNHECVFACDIDKNCREIYEKNYNIKPEGDITKIDIETIPDCDIICGGFPCQTFSNSGKKKGFDDDRGNLFEYILKIAVKKSPSYMFLENVKHIKKIDGGKVFTHIIKRIEETGFSVKTIEISPHHLGIPQQRERIIFICIKKELYKDFTIERPNYQIKFDNIFEKNVDPKYNISNEIRNVLDKWDEMIQVFETGQVMSPTILCKEFYNKYTSEEFSNLPKWKQDYITKNKPIYNKYKKDWDIWFNNNSDILSKREIYSKLEYQAGCKKENDSIYNYFIQLRQSGIRVKKSDYFPTLVAIVQTPIYGKEKRYITPRECARLQSFPDTFIIHEKDHTAYKQFGNAVNVDVIYYVLSKVL